ncbi:NADH peroxidase Npx [Lentilactobacillus kosonis]|uniref:NADH peroxidase Npx n=2 Tax=Lentilactobacillus kosonis TaxID=2810561 RepID=A0A401FHQ9_9LACO|nr:NADH peroxidase Npx [Lentilactobacillus kosonis]
MVGTDLNFHSQEKVQFKLIYDPVNFQILGGQVMSKANISDFINTISLAIQMEMTIEQLADADFFFHPSQGNEENVMSAAAHKAVKLEHLD